MKSQIKTSSGRKSSTMKASKVDDIMSITDLSINSDISLSESALSLGEVEYSLLEFDGKDGVPF